MSDAGSDDSELNRAIALSLGGAKELEIVDLLTDDEHDDPQKMAEASKPQQGMPGPLGMLGLDRRKMEEERLARARKRKLSSISPPPLARRPRLQEDAALSATGPDKGSHDPGAKKLKIDHEPIAGLFDSSTETRKPRKHELEEERVACLVPRQLPDSKPAAVADPGHEIPRSGNGAVANPDTKYVQRPKAFLDIQQENLLAPGIHFPNGTVRKTWTFGYTRKDDIKIEEVLQKNDLELAVLSAYQWDEEWILGKLNISRTRVTCVVQAESEEQKVQMRANVPSNIRFCFPSMAGQINCMHSKLQLLSYPTHLRIVVPSANLVPYDWGENGGRIENIVFIIDLPRLPKGQRTALPKLTLFGRELRNFLNAMDIDASILSSLLDFDFSRTANLAFVHSIGGSHSESTWKHTGYCGLGSAIKELGLATKGPLDIDYVTASIGNLKDGFIKCLYLAAQGDDGSTELNWRTSKNFSNGTEAQTAKEIEKGFRIYFPSRETVVKSRGGANAGGTICFQSNWFDSATFPRSLMRDCESMRSEMLMHNKMLFVRPHKPLKITSDRDNQGCVAWAYVGSANLSESAWGRLVKDKSTKEPRLNVRNWECGVVVPVSDTTTSYGLTRKAESERNEGSVDSGVRIGPTNMDVFDGVIPVPMVVPGEEYGEKRPWFYTER